jgi:hypothetical protein
MPATIGTFLFSSLARGTVPCRRLSSQAAPSHERTRRLCRAGCGRAVKVHSNVFEIGDKKQRLFHVGELVVDILELIHGRNVKVGVCID